jgi:hypothetical protein
MNSLIARLGFAIAILSVCSLALFGQSTVKLTITCNGNPTEHTLLTIGSDPCTCTPGNVAISTCLSCAATFANTYGSSIELRVTPHLQVPTDPPSPGEASQGIPGAGSVSFNPISTSGLPAGVYDLYLRCPCDEDGPLIKVGKLTLVNC